MFMLNVSPLPQELTGVTEIGPPLNWLLNETTILFVVEDPLAPEGSDH